MFPSPFFMAWEHLAGLEVFEYWNIATKMQGRSNVQMLTQLGFFIRNVLWTDAKSNAWEVVSPYNAEITI